MLKGKKGFTLIELMIVVAIIAVIAAIAIPNLLRSKMAANEAAAIAAMRTYAGAQNIFHRTDYDGDGILEYAGPGQQITTTHSTFVALNTVVISSARIELIDNAFGGATTATRPKAGYYNNDNATHNGGVAYNAAFIFGLCGNPAQYNRTGLNTFVIDVQGTVYQRDQTSTNELTRFPNVTASAAPWIVCE